jgi:hypothetical protein
MSKKPISKTRITKTPQERFAALEQLRIQVHGTIPRLQSLHFGPIAITQPKECARA